ncbi:MAG: acetoacetate decarboxylase family protein [Rudaea sp.]|uniref:acetoacetate decarboxylase family protein n=1 Tax=Rudaea sp. TaxID=2136325 RepID=UPI0039E67A36
MSKLRFVQGIPTTRGATSRNTVSGIRVVYETDPAVVQAMLPRPLVAAEHPEVYLQFMHVAIHVSETQTHEIGALTTGLMCTHEGQPGAYCYYMAMEGESIVTSGRERFGEPKKVAQTTFKKDGDHVRATCARHGITFFELDGEIGADNDEPKMFEEYLYCYKALMSITTPGQFDGDVYLTRLDWKRNYTARRDFKGTVRFNESAYDPLIDVPIRRVTRMEYVEGGTLTSGRILATVPGEYIAPFWVGRFDDPFNPGIDVPAAKAA